MISRVTHQTMMHSAQRNLQASANKLAELQEKATTQKALTRPSDDPSATGSAMQVRAQQAANAQYSRNLDNGNTWLSTIDSALGSATNILRRARDLTAQAANDTLSPSGREAIAAELEGLNQDLMAQANTSVMGRSVFAGNSDTGRAFTATTPPTFTGAPGSTVERRISDSQTIRVDADGAATFGDGPASAFALLSSIVSGIRNGSDVSTQLGAIDDRITTVISTRAEVGTRQAHLQRAQETNMTEQGSLETQRTELEDVNLTEAVLDLQAQNINYQTALAVTAKVLPPTLMDFLR